LPPSASHRGGFTLLETIVSVAIMSIGLVAIIEAYGASMRLSLQDEYLTTATFLAAGKMEEVLKEPSIVTGSDHGDFGEGFEDYSWTVDITDSDIEGLETVTVTVAWNVAGIDDELVLTSAAPYKAPEESSSGGAQAAGGASR
jgi:prepilin-type N-terminal cleavage/methylation domain-containing protein